MRYFFVALFFLLSWSSVPLAGSAASGEDAKPTMRTFVLTNEEGTDFKNPHVREFIEMFANATLDSRLPVYALLIQPSGPVCGRFLYSHSLRPTNIYKEEAQYDGFAAHYGAIHSPEGDNRPPPAEISMEFSFSMIIKTMDGGLDVQHILWRVDKFGSMNFKWTTLVGYVRDGQSSKRADGKIALVFSISSSSLERLLRSAKGMDIKCK